MKRLKWIVLGVVLIFAIPISLYVGLSLMTQIETPPCSVWKNLYQSSSSVKTREQAGELFGDYLKSLDMELDPRNIIVTAGSNSGDSKGQFTVTVVLNELQVSNAERLLPNARISIPGGSSDRLIKFKVENNKLFGETSNPC